MLLSQTVDRVLHGVGGEHALVVSHGVRRFDISLEQDLDTQIGEIVARIGAVDLGDSNICLAPAVFPSWGISATPIGGVSVRAEQQWDVIMIPGVVEVDDDMHFGEEGVACVPGGEHEAVDPRTKRDSRLATRPSSSVTLPDMLPATVERALQRHLHSAPGWPETVSSTCVLSPVIRLLRYRACGAVWSP